MSKYEITIEYDVLNPPLGNLSGPAHTVRARGRITFAPNSAVDTMTMAWVTGTDMEVVKSMALAEAEAYMRGAFKG